MISIYLSIYLSIIYSIHRFLFFSLFLFDFDFISLFLSFVCLALIDNFFPLAFVISRIALDFYYNECLLVGSNFVFCRLYVFFFTCLLCFGMFRLVRWYCYEYYSVLRSSAHPDSSG